MPIRVVQILFGAYPNDAVAVGNDIPGIEVANPLLLPEALETGAEKTIDSVLCGQPEKALTVRCQCIDGKVPETVGLAIGAEDILLRLQTGRKSQ